MNSPAPKYLCCVLVLEATSSALASQVTPAWLARCAAACEKQLQNEVASFWGLEIGGVRVGSGPTDVQPGEMVFAIVDSLPDAPGAIAYHDVAGAAVPVGFLALSTCSTLDDVSPAISHELGETTGDPDCNRWADDGAGNEWALELCDAVESNSYTVDLGDGQAPIKVSDFVLPSFFAAGAAAPYNFVQSPAPSVPFATATGGYQIKRSSGANETQVQALSPRPRRVAGLATAHASSRVGRRGLAPSTAPGA